jgi:hypothetical protein
MQNFTSKKYDNNIATFGAGVTLIEALLFLNNNHNRTLQHVPAYAGMTMGGMLGSGSHGSSLLHPTLISDQVTSIIIIDLKGSSSNATKEIKNNNDTDFKAFQLNLGLLGIVVEVSLKTVPLFSISVETRLESDSMLFDNTAVTFAKTHNFFQLWWFPSSKDVVVLKGNNQTETVSGNASINLITNQDPSTVSSLNTALERLQFRR